MTRILINESYKNICVWYLITLDIWLNSSSPTLGLWSLWPAFSKNLFVSLVRILPYTWYFFLVLFHYWPFFRLFDYKSPPVHVEFGIDLNSILGLFPIIIISWIKFFIVCIINKILCCFKYTYLNLSYIIREGCANCPLHRNITTRSAGCVPALCSGTCKA